MHPNEFSQQRHRLVAELRRQGIRSEAVLRALLTVPRELFVPVSYQAEAYRNTALPIGSGQTISQPLMVAQMSEALLLEPTDRVLEVGAGSGYLAAVLSQIVCEVYTIERLPDLAQVAGERLRDLHYSNVHVRQGDGTRGWPEQAPFDAIVVSAGGPDLPRALINQLQVGGRLVIPLGNPNDVQELTRVIRRNVEVFDREELGAVRFVPLVIDSP